MEATGLRSLWASEIIRLLALFYLIFFCVFLSFFFFLQVSDSCFSQVSSQQQRGSILVLQPHLYSHSDFREKLLSRMWLNQADTSPRLVSAAAHVETEFGFSKMKPNTAAFLSCLSVVSQQNGSRSRLACSMLLAESMWFPLVFLFVCLFSCSFYSCIALIVHNSPWTWFSLRTVTVLEAKMFTCRLWDGHEGTAMSSMRNRLFLLPRSVSHFLLSFFTMPFIMFWETFLFFLGKCFSVKILHSFLRQRLDRLLFPQAARKIHSLNSKGPLPKPELLLIISAAVKALAFL